MSFLEEVIISTERAVAERRRKRSLRALAASVSPRADEHRFLNALREPGISVIAEFKRSSPSRDSLAPPDASVLAYAGEYERGGARALSILTERRFFSGELGDLREARESTKLPLLRKDFVVGEYQVYEAAEVGADAVLLIAAVLLDDGELRSLYELTRSLGMDALLEVRDHKELQRVLSLEPEVVGVNNRNLKTRPSQPRRFDIDTGRTHRLFAEVSESVTTVAESGLEARAQLDELEEMGIHGALVGSALMQAQDRTAKCLELTRAPGVDRVGRVRQPAAFVS